MGSSLEYAEDTLPVDGLLFSEGTFRERPWTGAWRTMYFEAADCVESELLLEMSGGEATLLKGPLVVVPMSETVSSDARRASSLSRGDFGFSRREGESDEVSEDLAWASGDSSLLCCSGLGLLSRRRPAPTGLIALFCRCSCVSLKARMSSARVE